MVKTERFKKISYFTIRAITIILVVWSIIDLIFTNDDSTRSRCAFIIFQAVLLFVCTTIVPIVEKSWKLEVPDVMEVVFLAFAMAHMLLGEIGNFYATVPWWDSMLHTISGGIIAVLGFSFVNILNNNSKSLNVILSPGFICFFSLCFAVALGGIWEIFEYLMDEFTLSNMQRYQESLPPYNPFIGHDALNDTMKDLMLDFLGASVICVIGYFNLKKNKNSFTKWQIVKVEKEDDIDESK